jgi:hypothetical protein
MSCPLLFVFRMIVLSSVPIPWGIRDVSPIVCGLLVELTVALRQLGLGDQNRIHLQMETKKKTTPKPIRMM